MLRRVRASAAGADGPHALPAGKQAAAGDVQAFNAIRDITGEKPKDEIDSKVATSMTIHYVKSGAKFASSEDEVDDDR